MLGMHNMLPMRACQRIAGHLHGLEILEVAGAGPGLGQSRVELVSAQVQQHEGLQAAVTAQAAGKRPCKHGRAQLPLLWVGRPLAWPCTWHDRRGPSRGWAPSPFAFSPGREKERPDRQLPYKVPYILAWPQWREVVTPAWGTPPGGAEGQEVMSTDR
jgi:hypothetical protein